MAHRYFLWILRADKGATYWHLVYYMSYESQQRAKKLLEESRGVLMVDEFDEPTGERKVK